MSYLTKRIFLNCDPADNYKDGVSSATVRQTEILPGRVDIPFSAFRGMIELTIQGLLLRARLRNKRIPGQWD